MSELESLFLLEVLVDCVVFTTDEAKSLRETCVQFRFLQFPSFEVCEDDFAPSGAGYDSSDVPFNAGKSLLFSMPQFKAGQNINLDVLITKSDENRKKRLMGKTAVPLGSSFTNLFLVSNKRQLTEPIAKTIRDTFVFFNEQNVETGKIGLLVRLSCFGSAIVTQFEVNDQEEQSYKFNNEVYSKKDQDKKLGGEHFDPHVNKDNGPSNSYPPNSYPPNSYPPNSYPPNSCPPNSYPPNSYPPGPSPKYQQQQSAMRYPNQPMQQQPQPDFRSQMGYCPQSPQMGTETLMYQNYLYQQYSQTTKIETQKSKGAGQVSPNCSCKPPSPPRPVSAPKPVFRRCYVLGEGIGPSPRTGDLFSWVSPSKTDKDKEREELLGGPKISWEISSVRAPQKGDIIKIEPTTLRDQKPSDGDEKLGKRGKISKTEKSDSSKVVKTRVVFEDEKKTGKKVDAKKKGPANEKKKK